MIRVTEDEAVKIQELEVDGFGVWKGLKADGLTRNVTVFYGQNEAGKTTLMQFVRSMLFGFSPDRREKYVPPVYGGLAGGTLTVTSGNSRFEIQRHVDPNRHADPVGDLTLIDEASGDVHGQVQLSNLLSNIDEPIFNNVFAVGLREIQELNALNNTQAADHLYRLTSGLDRVSLVEVMRDVTRRRESLWAEEAPGATVTARLNALYRRRLTLQREIDDLRTRSRRWARIAAQAREAQLRLEDSDRRIRELERESRLVETAIQVSERWARRAGVIRQIASFGVLPDPRDISVTSLDELNTRISRQREKISQTAQQRKKIRKQADALGLNKRVWSQRNRIEALISHAPWIESLQKNALAVSAEAESVAGSIAGEIDGLGGHLKLKQKDIELLASRNFVQLKTISRELGEQQERVNRLKDEGEKCRFDLSQHEKSLGDSLSETSGNIPETLEDTSRHVNRLRRRVELEEKIEKLQRNQSELEREVDDVVEDQVLPVGKLAVVGTVFVIGAIMALLGMFSTLWPEWFGKWGEAGANLGFLLMLMGIVFGLISMAVKYHWERVARENFEDYRHQMEMVRQQLKRARSERDEIDRLLPGMSGQHDLDLKDAENRLARLEDLMPMENRVKTTRLRLEEIRRQIATQERELENCEKRWQSALRTIGLPESLAPAQVREISQRSGRISGLSSRLESLRAEQALREKELADVAIRIEELARDTALQMTVSKRHPLEALSILTAALGEQRQLMISRREHRTQYLKLRGQQARLNRELDALLGQHTKLLAAAGVKTEAEYRQLDLKHAQCNALIAERNQLTEQIAAGLGKTATEDQVRPLLESLGTSGLEKRWEALGAEIDGLKKEYATLLQQRGELLQEIKALGEDNKLDLHTLELNCVEQEISDLQRQWQVLATTSQMLETIREGYESKRQPETLREASAWLDKLTEGAYQRIWTRMTGEELLVDNGKNETITVDKLSRGTREAVYLSLRLALLGVYARRGAVLPLVLDDILVNFDAQRARKAGEVLMSFAQHGYQILMFTCHDHMRDLFHDLGADVRVLPHHKDVVEHQARPVPWNPTVALPAPVPAPVVVAPPVARPAPVPRPRPVPASPLPVRVNLRPSEYDEELQFELSEIARIESGRPYSGVESSGVSFEADRELETAGTSAEAWYPIHPDRQSA